MSGDGLVRCPWAEVRPGPDAQLYRDYHDNEWGRPLYGRVALFERMSLEAFQSGLSWLIILRKRNFRRAFSGFDIDKIARYTDTDVRRLLADDGIVRNRAKIEATIANARSCRSGVVRRPIRAAVVVRATASAPARRRFRNSSVSTESKAMSRELKRRGFRFVGPTTAYALMQATGMVDDHIQACWVPTERPFDQPGCPMAAR